MNLRTIAKLTLLMLPAVFLSGCATRALWQRTSYVGPASNPNLKLSLASPGNDLLVEYDEMPERSSSRRPRAYLLYENLPRIEAQRRPTFVDPRRITELTPVLIVPTTAPAILLTNDLYVVAATNSFNFSVYSNRRELGLHQLPIYVNGARRTGQVLLTPLTVVADVTMVSAVVGFVLWAKTGFPPFSEQSRGH
jgi:hypothetical protein